MIHVNVSKPVDVVGERCFMTRIAILGGGLAGLETAVSLAADLNMEIEVIERGSSIRVEHVAWDSTPCPDDSKVRTWAGNGWGGGDGLNEGLGGRSRYYSGVMLPIEAEALKSWPRSLQAALLGEDDMYGQVTWRLAADFPEMEGVLSEEARNLGLRHVPQAAFVDGATGRFRAYSPLPEAIRLAQTSDVFTLVKGVARKLISQRNGRWSVEISVGEHENLVRSGFDAVVLGASAIGNVQIMAETFGQEISTTITDHFSVGALLRAASSIPLGGFRHSRLWAGYLSMPSLGSNIFVGEIQAMPNGDRILDINAVIEQGDGLSAYSTLTATPQLAREGPRTAIDARVSQGDENRINLIASKVLELASEIANQKSLVCIESKDKSYDNCMELLTSETRRDAIAFYRFPYGAFEHEACTMPAGGARQLGVTDEFEVAGSPGVFAVGPGSFTRPGAANPALTILATSRIVAQVIRNRYSCAATQ